MKTILLGLVLALAFAGNANAGKKPSKKRPVPAFSAKSFIVTDTNGVVLKEQNSAEVRSIASITKLVIGLIASEQDLDEELDVTGVRKVQTSIPYNVAQLSRRELLTLSLVKSDNYATQILCNNIENCVDEMNAKVRSLEMYDTHFNEPTGLDNGNVSTARDLVKLAIVASSNHIVTSLSSMPDAEIPTNKATIRVNNTNPLTRKLDILLSKTGTTRAAGGCLVMILNSDVGQRVLVLLGSKSGKTRINDMEHLVNNL